MTIDRCRQMSLKSDLLQVELRTENCKLHTSPSKATMAVGLRITNDLVSSGYLRTDPFQIIFFMILLPWHEGAIQFRVVPVLTPVIKLVQYLGLAALKDVWNGGAADLLATTTGRSQFRSHECLGWDHGTCSEQPMSGHWAEHPTDSKRIFKYPGSIV